MRQHERQPGFVLLVTMVVLLVLSSLVAGLAVRLTMARRRQSYMIEYQRARYALDSAMKYSLAEMPRQTFKYADRKGKPDFSDLFIMDRHEYAQFIADWMAQATDEQIQAAMKKGASLPQPQLSSAEQASMLLSIFGGGTQNDPNAPSMDTNPVGTSDANDVMEIDPNDIEVPGPYDGAEWPYVTKPVEYKMGPAKVTIEIEDENAKLPLSWFVTSSKTVNKRADDALDSFCEWMAWTPDDLQALEKTIRDGTKEIQKKKSFQLNAGPIVLRKTTTRTVSRPKNSRTRVVTSRRRPSRTSTVTRTTTEKRPAIAHRTDFAKLFHSSLLNKAVLARPLPDTGQRVESPLKYLGLWGSQRVNINTAPRHVLEAAFTMVMDSFDIPEFVDAVIKRRQEKPFKKLDELKDIGSINADTFKQIDNYMTTTSTFFMIRVTSCSGNAKASAVATVVKEGSNTQTLAILYSY